MKTVRLNILAAIVLMGFVFLQTAKGAHLKSLPETGDPGWNYQYETAMDSTSDTHGSGGNTSDSKVAGGVMTITSPDFFDYRTTTDLDTITQVKIRGDLEWVFRVDVNVITTPTSSYTRIVGVGDEGDLGDGTGKDGDLFEFHTLTATGAMRVVHGGGNYDFTVSAGMHVYEFHFTSNHVIDVYVDDALETTGLTAIANPNVDHRLSFVRFAGNAPNGTFSVDKLQAANIIPEPNITSVVEVACISLAGQQFDTCGDNDVYKLQSTTNPPTGPWVDTGAHTSGDNNPKILFDPTGPNGALTYRVQRLTNSTVPDPVPDTNQTGISVPFDVDLDGVNWGRFNGALGSWTVSNGTASIITSNSDLRLLYQPTLFNDTANSTNLSGDGWVVAFKFKYNSTNLLTLGSVEGGPSTNKYEIQFPGPKLWGNNLFAIDIQGVPGLEAGPFTIPTDTYISVAIYFKGTNNLIDIYFGGLRVQDFDLATHPTVSGPFLLDQVQIAGGGPSTSELELRGLFAGPIQTSDTTIASSSELRDTIAVSIAAETGKTYQLQQANDLVTEEFEFMGTRVTGNGGTQQLYEVLTSQSTQSFLRAVEVILF